MKCSICNRKISWKNDDEGYAHLSSDGYWLKTQPLHTAVPKAQSEKEVKK
jgi:hypothetical protein